MATKPQFLVCTMWCGEPDYNHCVRAIARQKDVVVQHQIISYLPEREAHNVVYEAFNRAGPYWIRAKIDADVELLDDNVLARVAQRFVEKPMAHGIDPTVLDYMTDAELHAGVAFYTYHVQFGVQTDGLLCDRGMVLRSDEHWLGLDIGPVGKHMYHANELTAFRYGFHRGLKRQETVRLQVKAAYERHRDAIRAMALKGFDAGLKLERGAGHNYGDETLMSAFRQART
jgi:hypothetical protein